MTESKAKPAFLDLPPPLRRDLPDYGEAQQPSVSSAIDWLAMQDWGVEEERYVDVIVKALTGGQRSATLLPSSPDGEARYLTDDRDLDGRHELKISFGGNGDWYVSVLPEGARFGPSVRLCTSGGASSAVPGLTVAIADAYRALVSAGAKGRSDG